MNLLDMIPFIKLYPMAAQIIMLLCVLVFFITAIFVPQKPIKSKNDSISIEHTINKKFQVNLSLTDFKKHNDKHCIAVFNIMNVGD
ncbi:MAG: hypothetical protein KAS66_12775 [Candidatus Omnitrophica bacterium]|nr:hypothetical protein [Candidatus Omnitrophota bacterium]